jgi:3'-phosphoadenosine 5'-phosphosulfate sulfotransferase (PAPS reductase)/FAD synthetase
LLKQTANMESSITTTSALPANMLEYIQSGSFPVVIAFSGGKDSVAMVLHMLEQGISKDRIHLHHHDVDGGNKNKLWDWECTETYCKAFAQALGLKYLVSYREGGITREIYRKEEGRQNVYYQTETNGAFNCILSDKKAINTRMKFPAVAADLNTRWCSSTVKIDVLGSVIRYNSEYNNEVVVLTGERREESTARAKYKEVEMYRAATKKRKAILWRCIIDWTEQDVWDIMQRWNIQPHPAYMIGWNRCSCQTCIFGSGNIWATINKISPEKVEAIAQIEKDTAFTLYSKLNIYQKVATGKVFEGMDQYWIDQATGEFTTQIFVENWTLPAGAFKSESAGSI